MFARPAGPRRAGRGGPLQQRRVRAAGAGPRGAHRPRLLPGRRGRGVRAGRDGRDGLPRAGRRRAGPRDSGYIRPPGDGRAPGAPTCTRSRPAASRTAGPTPRPRTWCGSSTRSRTDACVGERWRDEMLRPRVWDAGEETHYGLTFQVAGEGPRAHVGPSRRGPRVRGVRGLVPRGGGPGGAADQRAARRLRGAPGAGGAGPPGIEPAPAARAWPSAARRRSVPPGARAARTPRRGPGGRTARRPAARRGPARLGGRGGRARPGQLRLQGRASVSWTGTVAGSTPPSASPSQQDADDVLARRVRAGTRASP